MSPPWPAKVDVFGTGISTTSFDEIADLVAARRRDRAVRINVCNVHSVISARRDAELATTLAGSEINTPDGMPLVWVLRSLGHKGQTRVNGSDLTLRLIERGVAAGWRHYFYGATPETLARLTAALERGFPGVQIAGTFAPPFRALAPAERADVLERVRASRPDIVWVGLGMPKQEKWMHEVHEALPGVVLVGIGAAFDFLAGTKAHAPRWMQERGLEWLFRLGSEPRRLWRRYLSSNPAFLALWLQQGVAQLVRRRT